MEEQNERRASGSAVSDRGVVDRVGVPVGVVGGPSCAPAADVTFKAFTNRTVVVYVYKLGHLSRTERITKSIHVFDKRFGKRKPFSAESRTAHRTVPRVVARECVR